MPPSKLGPLAGRTLRGSSLSPSPSPSSPARRHPSSSGAGPSAGSPNRRASSSVTPSSPSSSSHSQPQGPPPYLLPREAETTYHRRLRSSLVEFARLRQLWSDEVEETSQCVARYAEALGEVEDERGSTGRAKMNASAATREALEDLGEAYADLDVGWKRVQGAAKGLLRVRDEAGQLEREWVMRSEEVGWGPVGGEELVASMANLSLQVQLQTKQLQSSLETLLVECSPLGSLVAPTLSLADDDEHSDDDEDAATVQRPPRRQARGYRPSAASRLRKEVLTTWRDLPYVEQSGKESFEWCLEVWRSEVGRWDEFASGGAGS